ncbi:hypothetical protein FOL47_000132 [Perkinsus chesapeaki]|uniref:Uncharacterized protein n=1 Tax=Perkinsus chesapeaki TaxID=330153 RepID=A0A7J6N2J6_PERCH|nr:hypothetical protein FOL47_000132 [Perkinsus chesapeaki]
MDTVTPHTSSTTQSSTTAYTPKPGHHHHQISSMIPISPERNSILNGGNTSSRSSGYTPDSEQRLMPPSSEDLSRGRQRPPYTPHYEDFGYPPRQGYPARHYMDQATTYGYPPPPPRIRSPQYPGYGGVPYDQGRYVSPPARQYPTYDRVDRRPPPPTATGPYPSYGYHRGGHDGIAEIRRAAEDRMMARDVTNRREYRLPGNGPLLKKFRVYLEKQGQDNKLGAVLSEITLPAVKVDEYGAGLKVKSVMEGEDTENVGLLARWNSKARGHDRDVRVGDVIVAVVDGMPPESIGPDASARKLMDKLKDCLACYPTIIMDVIREVPPLQPSDWPQTQQLMLKSLEGLRRNLEGGKDQAVTWFVGSCAPIILSPMSQLWCPLCECKQQTLGDYLDHFASPEHHDNRVSTASKFDSRWARLPVGNVDHYWFEYCYGFTSIVDPAELDPYAEFCSYSPDL